MGAAALLLPACRDAKVAYYAVPKEKDPELPVAAPPGPDMAGAAVPTASGPVLTWTAPANWRPKPASAMRKGSYTVTGAGGATADLSITAFPGDVGGELANVNRWRGQVGLAPLGEGDLQASAGRLESNGLRMVVVDLSGSPGAQRLLGAIIPFGDGTWFIKLMGPDALVAQEKASFLDFLRTVRPAGGP
jgi:hypothetical protein